MYTYILLDSCCISAYNIFGVCNYQFSENEVNLIIVKNMRVLTKQCVHTYPLGMIDIENVLFIILSSQVKPVISTVFEIRRVQW